MLGDYPDLGLGELLEASATTFDQRLNICVWDKGKGGMGSLYRSQHEMIAVLKKGKASHINNVSLGKTGRNRTNIWFFPGMGGLPVGLAAVRPGLQPGAENQSRDRSKTWRGELIDLLNS